MNNRYQLFYGKDKQKLQNCEYQLDFRGPSKITEPELSELHKDLVFYIFGLILMKTHISKPFTKEGNLFAII